MFGQKYENYKNFLSENFQFLVLKFPAYLNRHVFVMISHFRAIVYTRAKVYIHQNFFKEILVIIYDHSNKTARLYELLLTVIYSRAILVAVTLECHVKWVICKTWTGTLANNAGPDQMTCSTWRLVRVCTVGLNYWKSKDK